MGRSAGCRSGTGAVVGPASRGCGSGCNSLLATAPAGSGGTPGTETALRPAAGWGSPASGTAASASAACRTAKDPLTVGPSVRQPRPRNRPVLGHRCSLRTARTTTFGELFAAAGVASGGGNRSRRSEAPLPVRDSGKATAGTVSVPRAAVRADDASPIRRKGKNHPSRRPRAAPPDRRPMTTDRIPQPDDPPRQPVPPHPWDVPQAVAPVPALWSDRLLLRMREWSQQPSCGRARRKWGHARHGDGSPPCAGVRLILSGTDAAASTADCPAEDFTTGGEASCATDPNAGAGSVAELPRYRSPARPSCRSHDDAVQSSFSEGWQVPAVPRPRSSRRAGSPEGFPGARLWWRQRPAMHLPVGRRPPLPGEPCPAQIFFRPPFRSREDAEPAACRSSRPSADAFSAGGSPCVAFFPFPAVFSERAGDGSRPQASSNERAVAVMTVTRLRDNRLLSPPRQRKTGRGQHRKARTWNSLTISR